VDEGGHTQIRSITFLAAACELNRRAKVRPRSYRLIGIDSNSIFPLSILLMSNTSFKIAIIARPADSMTR